MTEIKVGYVGPSAEMRGGKVKRDNTRRERCTDKSGEDEVQTVLYFVPTDACRRAMIEEH